jgi:hypothetical protein
MVYFLTKNRNLGTFWCMNFMDIWSILRPFDIFYDNLAYFSPFWYIEPRKIWQPCWEDGPGKLI